MYYPAYVYINLAQVESNFWWFRARNALILWVLQKKISSFSTFFEIGCGTGFVLEAIAKEFPHARMEGGEYFAEAFAYAKARVPRAHFRQLDITALPETNSYELIGIFDVLEHIEKDSLAIFNIASALIHKGYVLITVPQHLWLWSSADEQACHVRRYTRKELFSKLEVAHLHVVYASSFVSFLLPFMFFSRLFRKKNEDILAEFNLPAWLNNILKFIMDIEFFLLRIGIRFPFGGSLICLAQKK